MKNTIDFLVKLGTLKGKKRRGWVVHRIKNPETTAEHIFRTTFLAWLLGRKKRLNIEKLIKMALVHDICEVYAFDETPYDPILPKDPKEQKKIQAILKRWPTFSPAEKKNKVFKKYQRELKGLKKVVSALPNDLKAEMINLWMDFEKGLSPEGRFLKQVDKAENLLQGLEYWKREGKIQRHLWGRWSKEIFDDPVLIDFVKDIDKKFHKR